VGKRVLFSVHAGILLLLVVNLAGCFLPKMDIPDSLSMDTPDSPRIDNLPYTDPEQVWISRAYEAGHQGIDISADQVIDIVSPGEGTFLKSMYYHAGVPRWQVNAEIRQGGYAVELLLEPGNSVSEAEAQIQYEMLIPNGTEVKAGDLLGQRYIAYGQPYSILHMAVRQNSNGTFFCPLGSMAEQAVSDLLELFHRDHPGEEICTLGE